MSSYFTRGHLKCKNDQAIKQNTSLNIKFDRLFQPIKSIML